MPQRIRITLGQLFVLTFAGLVMLLGLLFSLLWYSSRESILKTAVLVSKEVGLRVSEQVISFRDQAEDAASNIEQEFQQKRLRLEDQDGLESALYTEVLKHPEIGDVSFTHADSTGSKDGNLQFAAKNHWEVSIYRDETGKIVRRRIYADATQPADDPTNRLTFQVLTSAGNLHRPIWSDLHYGELASGQIEVSVQESLFDGDRFLGVVRVGLLVSQLNQIVARGAAGDSDDPKAERQICFLCDPSGRLVTPIGPQDKLAVFGDDLRIGAVDLPPQIEAALHRPELQAAAKTSTTASAIVSAGDQRFLVSYLPLPRTQDWMLAVIANENYYLGDLIAARSQFLVFAAVVTIIILLGGILTLRIVQRGLVRIIGVTGRMRHFDFAPAETHSALSDLETALGSLEQAKTAIRAMGKYVPLDLVRQLYDLNREPQLGGELRDLSILFTDIQGFTAISESLPPDRLAIALGEYLQAMAAAVQSNGGTIDKYSGDGIMAIWNAPLPCDDHPQSLAAVLACSKAAIEVATSPAWRGLPPPITRCGLHHDRVILGHFGAPDRMSYTALGDGVNLASRLESLNKQYGTTRMVSQTIVDAAGDHFHFRLLDRVAVKGKMQPVNVYELLEAPSEAARKYEIALRAYWKMDFTAALEILNELTADPPSCVLAERCRMLLDSPPPPDWDGVFIAMSK